MRLAPRFASGAFALSTLVCATRAQVLTGIHWDTGQLYSIDASTGAALFVASTGLTQSADIEFAPNGELYGAFVVMQPSGFNAFEIHHIDRATGATTWIGTTNLPGQTVEGDVAFAPSGLLYGGWNSSGGGQNLFTFDLQTGATQLLGAVAGATDISGLAFRSDGKLVGIQWDAVLVIDPATLQVLQTFSLAPTLGPITGLTESGGTMYFSVGSPPSYLGSSELWELDPFTGAHGLAAAITPPIGGAGLSGLAGEACGGSLAYCTAGTSSHGCVPSMSSSGVASLASASGFILSTTALEGQRSALLYYGLSGALALPWGAGGSSWLCVKPPTQRTPVQFTGGTASQCDGSLALDWFAYQAANPSAYGNPFSAGTSVWAQTWYRDPPSVKATSLSDALRFSLCP